MAEVTITRRSNRTQDEWNTVALEEIVPALQGGATMTEIRAQYGAGNTIRAALTRVGYNTKGQPIELVAVKGSNKKVLAKRVADRRMAGAAWWRISLETGLDKQALVDLLAAHNQAEANGQPLTGGRVVISERGLKRLERERAEAEAAAKAATPKRRRTRKAASSK
jgi:hypothetical protein